MNKYKAEIKRRQQEWRKRNMPPIGFLSLIALVFCATECSDNENKPKDPEYYNSLIAPQYRPQENPNPSNLLKISGHIDVGLHIKGVYLDYVTTEKSCEVEESMLVGAHEQYFRLRVPVQQQDEHYQTLVPLDWFERGRCGWSPTSVAPYLADAQLLS